MDPVDLQMNADVTSAADIAFLAIAMALAATLLWVSYRTMQHPRLPVNRSDERRPSVTVSGVLRYAVTTPIMVSFWMLVLVTLLSAAAKDRTSLQILLAASAVIGGARLLAHVKEEIAHELAKAVPITILSFIIIGGGFTGIEPFFNAVDQIPWEVVDRYWVGLLVWDVFLTAVWFAAMNLSWTRRQRRVAHGGQEDTGLARVLRRLRDIGYQQSPS